VHVHIDTVVVPANTPGPGFTRAPAGISPPAAAIERAIGRALRSRVAAGESGQIASAVAEAVGRATGSSGREARPTPFRIGGQMPASQMPKGRIP
jgi:hypothetical protein